MTYQVLARKWRPNDFDSVVGQQAIVTALKNALKDGRIAQAYLFSGIRGVGKTSVARVLAKALNCEKGPENGPCNDCQACEEITRGADFDVQEVDAATFSKVEQIRELTESLKYGPARGRYKVVVLDEVHRLSRQAFDALLKIVEEPPDHLVFIFATTEIDTVPATILSRCQEFNFRRVAVAEMVEHLQKLAEAEQIEVSQPALRLIARAGEGSVRDSVALLDQLATFGSGKIADQNALALLGGVDLAVFADLLHAILAADRLTVLAVVEQVDDQGWDPRSVYTQFLAYCRDALHLAAGGGAESLDLSAQEIEALAELANASRYEDLLRLVHLLLESESTIRHSDTGSLPLEIAWLRGAELPRLAAIEAVLSGAPTPVPPRPSPKKPTRPASKPQTSGSRTPPARPAPAARQAATEKAASPKETAKKKPTRETPAASSSTVEETPKKPAKRSAQKPRPAAEPETPVDDAPAPKPTADRSNTRSDTPAKRASETRAAEVKPTGDPTAQIFQEVSRRREVLAGRLGSAENLSLVEGRLEIRASGSAATLEKALAKEINSTTLQEAILEVCGEPLPWTVRAQPTAKTASSPAAVPTETAAEADEISNDPKVQTVLDLFGGQIESIE